MLLKSRKVPKRTVAEFKLLISSWMGYAYSRYELFAFDSRIRGEPPMHNTSDAIVMQSI